MDFGPRIRTHPGMAITAARKMGSARPVRLNFAGQLRQTSRFLLRDVPWLQANLEATRRFFGNLSAPDEGDDSRPEWSRVGWESVVEFLSEYRSAQDPSSFDSKTLAQYIRTQARDHGELVRWRVAVRARTTGSATLKTENLGIRGVPEVNTIARSQLRKDPGSVGVITNPASGKGTRWQGDEEIGLSADQIDRARHRANSDERRRLGFELRQERDPAEGLLCVYPISRYSPGGTTTERMELFRDPESACTVVGLALVFPPSRSAAAVDYVAGAAWRDGEGE